MKRIYAVNYGHEGPFISYGVNDTSKAEYYRKNEPVKTLLLKSGNRRSRSSMQAIRLNGGEWTSYFVNSNEDFNASITLRVKAEKPGSELLVDINKKSQRFELPDTSWQDLLIDDFLIKEGPDSIYTIASKGTIELLHFDITKK